MPGVRVLTVTLPLIERVFEEGIERCVPIEPAKLRVLDVRMSRRYPDAVELLVESPSFPEEEAGATWATAKPHNQTFRRWDGAGLWVPGVDRIPEGARAVKVEVTAALADGRHLVADLPEGVEEVSGVDLSPPPTVLVRRAGKYEHVPLVEDLEHARRLKMLDEYQEAERVAGRGGPPTEEPSRGGAD